MFAPAGDEVLPVENAVVFVSDQFIQYVLILGARHHAEVIQRV